MPITDRAEEFLRARTLGFHTPRPGTRPSPREYDRRAFTSREISDTLDRLGLARGVVTDVSRCVSRRRVALVKYAVADPVLLKWPDEDVELDNDYEFVMLEMLASLPLPPLTRRAIPSILAGGPDTRVIALDAIEPCVSLHDLMKNAPVVPIPHLVGLAAVLAGLHRLSIDEVYPRYPEWLLMLPVPTTTRLSVREYSHGCGIDFEAYLRVMQELEPNFQELHAAWGPRGLVHFDLRDDNILFPPEPTGSLAPTRIIDWELAGFGDPFYDVGYVVGYLLMQWLRGGHDGGSPEAGAGLRTARRNAATFLSAYCHLTEVTEAELRRVHQYAGITLLVHASMRLQQLGSLGRVGHTCLLVGKRLVQQPDAVHLLRGGRPDGEVGVLREGAEVVAR